MPHKTLCDLVKESNCKMGPEEVNVLKKADDILIWESNPAYGENIYQQSQQLYLLGVVYIQSNANYIAAQDVAQEMLAKKKQAQQSAAAYNERLKLPRAPEDAQKLLQERKIVSDRIELINDLYSKSVNSVLSLAMITYLSKTEFLATYEKLYCGQQECLKKAKYAEENNKLIKCLENIEGFLKEKFEEKGC